MSARITYKPRGRRTLCLLVVALLIAASVQGQNSAAQVDASVKLPVYDVVSIKPNQSGSGSTSSHTYGDRYSASNVSLIQLLSRAYEVQENLISGVTGAIASVRFDIEAKVVDRDPKAVKKPDGRQTGQMLLPVLAERFQLKAHRETKILPVYVLIAVQAGVKFKPTVSDNPQGGGSTRVSGNSKGTVMTATNISMQSLADTLTGQVHRTVNDKTGLAGRFDLALNWTSDDSVSVETDGGLSIFTALQEQLGLKLQPAKGPVETLVVDHVEMPSAN